MVLNHLYVEGRTLPYRTPLRSPSTREADGRRSGSTALTNAIGYTPTVVPPSAPRKLSRPAGKVRSIRFTLFTLVRGREVLRSPHAGSCITPVLTSVPSCRRRCARGQ